MTVRAASGLLQLCILLEFVQYLRFKRGTPDREGIQDVSDDVGGDVQGEVEGEVSAECAVV